jgi:dihydropteroate synthase
MEFHEAASVLFDLRRYSPRPGTDATRELLAHLGKPHEGLRCVQIAGSNGKGSTARMVERALREAGLSVGLYTSPHLDDVRERVRTDGRPITEGAVVEFVEQFEPYAIERGAEGDSPTFFETLTAMALWEFDRQDVDVAVLEVGIGGTLDATSVVDPVASAVTSVTLEHQEMLGDTRAEIARDKAGVAPADAPLVTAATDEALAAIEDAVDDVLTVGERGAWEGGDGDDAPDVTVTYGGRDGLEGVVDVDGQDWSVETRLPLLGSHQATNAGVAAALVRQVADVDTETTARGLRNAHLPGRFEVMDRNPLVVLDGAHNPGGCERVAEVLDSFDYDDCHLVVGAMTDKDHRGMAAVLDGTDPATVTVTRPAIDRAETVPVLERAFAEETDAAVERESSVADALAGTLGRAESGDAVVVTGSLYVVGEARTRWARPVVPKTLDSPETARAALEDAHVADVTDETAARAVHRSVRLRLQPGQARRLRETVLSAGGACAVSALERQHQERVEVFVHGTLAQFETVTDRLAEDGTGLAPVASDIRAAVGLDGGRAERGYPWEDGTAVMGILNVTPDSFHDGGEYDALADARERAREMVDTGVDIIDVGGESTRPGADPVSVAEEKERVVPVVEAISDFDAMVSVDTRRAEVARAALDAGADILNDVSGLEDPEMRLVAAEYDAPVVVMHSIETPVDPSTDVEYDDVVADVLDYLTERVLLAEKAGLDREQILVDPGLGFGKSPAESFELLGRLDELRALGCPVLVGHSHKSMFGLVGGEAGDALDETVAATAIAAERGADVVRVHDPAENVAAVRVARAADDPDAFDDS